MTQSKLVAKIEKDIGQKGSAKVPMDIIREALSADTPVSTTLDVALEEFASNHGWHIQHEALPTHRVVFYPGWDVWKPIREEGKVSSERGSRGINRDV